MLCRLAGHGHWTVQIQHLVTLKSIQVRLSCTSCRSRQQQPLSGGGLRWNIVVPTTVQTVPIRSIAQAWHTLYFEAMRCEGWGVRVCMSGVHLDSPRRIQLTDDTRQFGQFDSVWGETWRAHHVRPRTLNSGISSTHRLGGISSHTSACISEVPIELIGAQPWVVIRVNM